MPARRSRAGRAGRRAPHDATRAIHFDSGETPMTDFVNVLDYGAVGDGTSNDTSAFAAALAADKPVFVPRTAASYLIANLAIPSNATIFGEGDLSLIEPHGTSPTYVFNLGSADDIHISGLAFEVDKSVHGSTLVIRGDGCERVTVSDCRMTKAGSIGVHLVNSTDCTVEKTSIAEYASHGILFGITSTNVNTNCRVLDCTVSTAASTAHGIMVQGGRRCLVQGNSATGGGCFGIHFEGCEQSQIADNTTANTYREGISLLESKYCSISNNQCYWDGDTGVDFGISVCGEQAPCSYNSISDNTVLNSNLSGIAIAGADEQTAVNHVSNNTIINCNREDLGNGAGVIVYGDAALDNLVTDNFAFDDTGKMRYGVLDDGDPSPYGTVIRNNRAFGSGSFIAPVGRADGSLAALNDQGFRAWANPNARSGTGSISQLGDVFVRFYEIERLVFIEVSVTVDTNGTGATDVRVDLPFPAATYASSNVSWVLAGRTEVTAGGMLQGVISDGGTYMRIFRYDNAYPVVANGTRLVLSGFYERAPG
jgi:parallel beta-helix repeat protein